MSVAPDVYNLTNGISKYVQDIMKNVDIRAKRNWKIEKTSLTLFVSDEAIRFAKLGAKDEYNDNDIRSMAANTKAYTE